MRALKGLLAAALLSTTLSAPASAQTSYLTPRAINLSYGTYTPTFTLTGNIASAALVSTAKGFWTRQGSQVTVSVEVSVTATASATISTLSISLPVASDIKVAGDVVGAGFSNTTTGPFGGPVIGSPASDWANYRFYPSSTTAQTHYVTFRYRVQ